MKDMFKCQHCKGTGKDNDRGYLRVYDPSRQNSITLETYYYDKAAPCQHCRGTGINLSKVIEVIEALEKKVLE